MIFSVQKTLDGIIAPLQKMADELNAYAVDRMRKIEQDTSRVEELKDDIRYTRDKVTQADLIRSRLLQIINGDAVSGEK